MVTTLCTLHSKILLLRRNWDARDQWLELSKGERGKDGITNVVHHYHSHTSPADKTTRGHTGPVGPTGPLVHVVQTDRTVWFALTRILIGSNFSKGDYVFRRSSKDGHDAMYVAQQNFVARAEPWDARDQWLELSKGERGPTGPSPTPITVSAFNNFDTSNANKLLVKLKLQMASEVKIEVEKEVSTLKSQF